MLILFMSFPLQNLYIDCKNATDKHIEGSMREWFRRDGDRKAGRNKRKQNQMQAATRLQTEFESVLT